MAYKIVIEPRALAEIQQAIDYYNWRLPGLGKKFEKSLEAHIRLISRNPFFQVRYKDYRVLPVKHFPYKIIYFLSESRRIAYITAVFHTSQNPYKQPT